MRTLIVTSWDRTPKRIQRAALVMWATGLALTAIGLAGDIAGWWESWPFLTNLLTGVTGFLVAVPIAVIVLEAISKSLDEHRARLTEHEARAQCTLELIERRLRAVPGADSAITWTTARPPERPAGR